jgi:hypothetical protein
MIEIEPNFTFTELAERLRLSYEKIRQLFRNEPGVIIIPSRGGQKVTYRVPESVVQRVLRRCTNPAPAPAATKSAAQMAR